MAKYKIRLGESLIDVCYNTTGAMSSIDAVMDANDITTYTPDLVPDTEITVPDVVYNSEAVQVANTRPFTSICAVDDAEIDAMIAELVTELEPPASTPSVTISPESPWTSDAQAVTITNNGNVSLSVISLPDFISKPTLPYALGIGDSLNVNVTSNGEAATRYGTISMEYADASGATIPYRVQVSQQAGASYYLKLNGVNGDISVNAEATASTLPVSIETNGTPKVVYTDSLVATSATIINDTVVINISANTTSSQRTGLVRISLTESPLSAHSISITQAAAYSGAHATLSPVPPFPSMGGSTTITNDGDVDLVVAQLPYYIVRNGGSGAPFSLAKNASAVLNIYTNSSGASRGGQISMTYKSGSTTNTYNLPVSQDEGELRQVIVVAPPGSSVSTDQYQFEFVIDGGADDFFVDAPFSSDSKAYISFDEILMQGHVDLNTHVGSQLIIYCIDIGATGEAPIDDSGDIEVELN